MDVLLDQESTASAADVPLIEEDPVDHSFDGLIKWSVLEDNVGRLAPEFECELLRRAGQLLLNHLADCRRPGKGHLVDIFMRDDM